jgi:hypothetical protein
LKNVRQNHGFFLIFFWSRKLDNIIHAFLTFSYGIQCSIRFWIASSYSKYNKTIKQEMAFSIDASSWKGILTSNCFCPIEFSK